MKWMFNKIVRDILTSPGFSREGKGGTKKSWQIGTCQKVVFNFYLGYTGQGSDF